VNEYLPAALLHLREAEIVRLCGLARAARGQEYARTGRVRQAERAAGTLRGAVLEGETTREALARFADSGLDAWQCSCSQPPPDLALSTPTDRAPCEHVAALLSLWVRDPEQFRAAALAAEAPPAPTLDRAPSSAPAPIPSAAAAAPAPTLADLEHLDQGARRFLNLLALADGSVTKGEAQRLFARLELGEPEAALFTLERLRQRGWVQPVFGAGSSSRQAAESGSPAGWSIPDDLLALLPRVLPLAPLIASAGAAARAEKGKGAANAQSASDAQTLEALPPETGLREQRAEAGLPALLLLIAAQAVDRSAPGSASAVSQKPASRSILDLDAALARQWAQPLNTTPERVRFGLALLRLLGVLPQTPTSRADERAGETLLRAYRLLLARPGAEVWRDLFTRWLHAHSARELVDLRDAGVRVGWLSQREARRSSDIAAESQAAREFIVNLLRWTPAGRWWSFSSLVEFVWRFQPAFLRGRQQTFLRPQWRLERLPGGQPLEMDVRAEWRQAEGRYIALLMRRALHWLGAVDLALDEQGRLKGFRLTPAGAFLLGTAAKDDETPEEVAEITVSSLPAALQFEEDGALLAPLAALRADMLEMLLRWCDPAGATGEALRFRASGARVAASLDAGQDLEGWLAWLERHPPGARLNALLAQLRRWVGLYGQARLYESAALLEVGDPALLRELEAALDLSRQFIDHSLGAGLAMLRPDAAEALIEEMQRRGYTPWILDHETLHGP
jgi:hypothetical protein